MAVHPLCRDEKRRGERGDDCGSRAVRCRAVVAMQCRRAAPRIKVQWRRCTRSPSACLAACPLSLRLPARGEASWVSWRSWPPEEEQCISNRSDPPPPPPPSLRSVRSCRKDDIGAHLMHASFCPFRALFFHPPHFHPTRCTSALSPFHSGSSGCNDNPRRQKLT